MIDISDRTICENCLNYSCSFLRTGLMRLDFCKLSSETTVCPTQILSDGPYESALKSGIIDKDPISKRTCVDCGLCVMNCPYGNLRFSNLRYDIDLEAFSLLTEPQLKATVTSYLGLLFTFAANTNRNKSLLFDGFISSASETKSFVEIDWKNDSLECARRILGDILLYRASAKVDSGLIVLQKIPSTGNRDIFNVLEKMRRFPTTKGIRIYITSITILRWLAIHTRTRSLEIEGMAYDPLAEDERRYYSRLNSLLPATAQIKCLP